MLDEIMDNELDGIIKDNHIVVIDFSAVWCGPCKALAPILTELQEKYIDDGVKFVKIDVDKNREIAMNNKIVAVPCIMIYKDGEQVTFKIHNKESDRIMGLLPIDDYIAIIDNLLEY